MHKNAWECLEIVLSQSIFCGRSIRTQFHACPVALLSNMRTKTINSQSTSNRGRAIEEISVKTIENEVPLRDETREEQQVDGECGYGHGHGEHYPSRFSIGGACVCVSSKNASKYINDEKCQTNPSSRDFRMMRLVTVVGPRRHIFIAKAPFRPEM